MAFCLDSAQGVSEQREGRRGRRRDIQHLDLHIIFFSSVIHFFSLHNWLVLFNVETTVKTIILLAESGFNKERPKPGSANLLRGTNK